MPDVAGRGAAGARHPACVAVLLFPGRTLAAGKADGDRDVYTEWEALTPLDARHWLLDNGYALEELSERARAALAWDSNHSEERRTHPARVARADKEVLESWQRRTGIAQVELLTQAVETLYEDLGDDGGGERGGAGFQGVQRGQDTQTRFGAAAGNGPAAEAYAAPGLSRRAEPVRSKGGYA